MDWVDKPQNYKDLYGILQPLRLSHLNNFPLKTLKPGWVAFHSVTFQLKCLDFQSNQYKKLVPVLSRFCNGLFQITPLTNITFQIFHLTLFSFHKNIYFYKNIEAEICEIKKCFKKKSEPANLNRIKFFLSLNDRTSQKTTKTALSVSSMLIVTFLQETVCHLGFIYCPQSGSKITSTPSKIYIYFIYLGVIYFTYEKYITPRYRL